MAPTDPLYATPKHPYTAALLAAVPKLDPAHRGRHNPPPGDIADPANLPSGCTFHPRCPYAIARCSAEAPALEEWEPGRWSACHRTRELALTGVQ